MIEQTWEYREKPMLEAIFLAEENGEDVGWGDVAARTGIDDRTTRRTIQSLHEAAYITGIEAPTFDGYDLLEIRLLSRGRLDSGRPRMHSRR